jgi:hypothetical protein
MEDLSSRIAELKQIIAEQEAYQRSPYNKYHYGHIWDAIAGDRSGLDAEAADEAAYRNMLLQQKFQAEQNELNRQNALELAKQNKANELETKKDEYIRGRNKAASVLNYAQQALSQDPNNIQLQKEVQLAKEDFDFYDRKLGGQGYDNIPVQTEQKSEGLDNKQINSIVKSIVDKKTYTDADRNKLLVLKEYVDDPVIKEQIDTVISNKKATKEDKDRNFKDAQEEFNRTGKYDSNLYKLDYSVDKNGKQIVKLVRK